MSAHRLSRAWQGGAAALGITVLLFFALLLAVAALDRSHVFEHRASVNQYRATQAFEAAEAGVEWALARLDDERPIGADCAPVLTPGAPSFRGQRLDWDAGNGRISPRTWLDGGVAIVLRSSCVRTADGWSCSCPVAARPVLQPPDTGSAPAFTVEFRAAARAGTVRVISTGCTSAGGVCADGVGSTDAVAQVEALFALLPALRSAPAAPLTVRGAIDADAATFGAHNADPASALALHAGGAVRAGLARLEGPAGTPSSDVVVANDVYLAALDGPHFFTGLYGLDPATWSSLPGVRRIACPSLGDCNDALRAALAIDSGQPLVRIDGALALEGPLDIGSTDRPAVVVASGAISLHGAVQIVGVLHGTSIEWRTAPGADGSVRGALTSEGDYRGDAAPDLAYDPAVMARLRGWSGSFVRLPGSWKDF